MKSLKYMSLFLAALFLLAIPVMAGKPPKITLDDLPVRKEASRTEYTVEKGRFEKTISTSGSLYYLNSLAISVEYSGAVLAEDITVKQGAHVEAGETLAILSLSNDPAQLKMKQLDYSQAQSQFDSSVRQYESDLAVKRAEAALLEGTEKEIALLALENMQIDLDMFRHDQQVKIDALAEQVDELLERSQPVEIKAPMSGIIESVLKNPRAETEVPIGTVLFTMYDSSKAWVKCSEMEYKNFIYGMPVEVFSTAAAIGFSSAGHVAASPHRIMEQKLDDDSVYISVDDPEALASLYSYCEKNNKLPAYIPLAVRGIFYCVDDALLLPTDAIHFDQADEDGLATSRTGWVYVKTDSGSIGKQAIIAGPGNEHVTCIFDGLHEGDCVLKDI